MMPDIVKLITDSDSMRFVGLAGPGTGKSFTFKTIIESKSFKNRNILVLSFINKLVNDLADDFRAYPNVDVATLHSFALSEYQRIASKEKVSLVDDLDQIISEDYALLNGTSISYSQRICDVALGQSEEDFYDERAEYYGSQGRVYSFNSIILAVNRLYENHGEHVTSKYDLVLVDEFQDFNKLEYEFIRHLNSKSKVVLVGDDDQSLYDWKFAQPTLIRTLYKSEDSVPFSLDYCYRCTEVIVKAVNCLIANAKNAGYLKERVDDKKYLYPHQPGDEKYALSEKYPLINVLLQQKGAQLIYQLYKRIEQDTADDKDARVLVIAPSYLKLTIYDGLRSKGYNIVDYELFADEKLNELKHKHMFDAFDVLMNRKTDNLMLRKLLPLYLQPQDIQRVVRDAADKNKKLWDTLPAETRSEIELDIGIYKKAKLGKSHLTKDELVRFSTLFNLKNLISKMVNGFGSTSRGSKEIELTTVMSSKGLSADFVYYIGIDDRIMFDRRINRLTDQKICEFLVGITRAKKKLTLFSLYDNQPDILNMIDSELLKISSNVQRREAVKVL